jgi:hypothetical protein
VALQVGARPATIRGRVGVDELLEDWSQLPEHAQQRGLASVVDAEQRGEAAIQLKKGRLASKRAQIVYHKLDRQRRARGNHE